jgi:hypothetical protein
MGEVTTFSEETKALEVTPELINRLSNFLVSLDQQPVFFYPDQLKDTPYSIRVTKTHSMPTPWFTVDIFDDGKKEPVNCFLELMTDTEGDHYIATGFYTNGDKDRFRKISALLSPFDDALCQSYANVSQKKVIRILQTHKQPIIDLMKKRYFTQQGTRSGFTEYTRSFDPQ